MNEDLNKSNSDFNSFDDFFEKIDLNKDIEELYKVIGDYEKQDKLEKNIELSELRNENHKRYFGIDILKYRNLPNEFNDITEDLIVLYDSIDSLHILEATLLESQDIKRLLNNIYRKIDKLDKAVEDSLKLITKSNDERQSKFSINYFNCLDINDSLRSELIDKYDDLILFSSNIYVDIYEDVKMQHKRKDYIDEILVLLNKDEENKINIKNKSKLEDLNDKINIEISKCREQIQYLEDIIPSNSRYLSEFEEFKNFCNKLMAYDDTSYDNTKQTYEILSDESKFKARVSNFEDLFIQEIIDKQNEEAFVYEKIGIKNLKKSLDYISANYMEKIDNNDKNVIQGIYDSLNSDDYDLNTLNKTLVPIVNNIWNKTITNVYEFNPNECYCFICSNNQFIDPKYQTILITNKTINRVDNYDDYQIGFICNYNENIMYITENDDIMSVEDYDDMSNLKTPLQLEQEFINFKVCNRIALNGFKTKIVAVYYINDGNIDKYIKAVELANMYKLPLIELKKNL